jgi:molybdopterin synthase catalytic subunit
MPTDQIAKWGPHTKRSWSIAMSQSIINWVARGTRQGPLCEFRGTIRQRVNGTRIVNPRFECISSVTFFAANTTEAGQIH